MFSGTKHSIDIDTLQEMDSRDWANGCVKCVRLIKIKNLDYNDSKSKNKKL